MQMREAGLVGAAAEQGRNRARENQQVGEDRPGLDVLELETDDLVEIKDLVPPAHLPRSGNAGHDEEPRHVALEVVRELFRKARPWPNKAHLAPEHVEELRQLVERRAPQESSDPRHAGIDFDLEQALVGVLVEMLERLPFFVRADPHRPEFHDVEELSTNACSTLFEEHRTAGIE